MPCPFPVSRQLFRSFFVPCKSRGNHARGTDIVLPSLKSTLSVSSVTVTFSATGTSASAVEIRIPRLLQFIRVCLHQFLDSPNLRPGKSTARMESYRFQPELRDFVIAFNVYMRWLISITCIEEKPVRAL